jgi:glutathione S-transferase
MYKLYQMQDSGNCYKIRLLLSHLQLPCEIVEVDITRGESRTPEFLAMNPNGKTPTLHVEGSTFLPESNAALWYLAQDTIYFPSECPRST